MSQNFNFQIVEDLSDQQLNAYTAKQLIAVDTELHGLKMNRDDICLVQLGDDARNVTTSKMKVTTTITHIQLKYHILHKSSKQFLYIYNCLYF